MNHDVLIESVAREITAGEPAANFRVRVMAALPPARNRWWPRLILPAGAMASLALAWLYFSTTGAPVSVGSPQTLGPAASVAQALASGEPVGRVELREFVPPGPRTRHSIEAAVSAEELAWHARAVPPLPALAALTIAPIQPIPLSIAPITVDPIVTDPIALAALDSRSGGGD